ncbi:hypothetical protein CPB84DRAFT_1792722 [Gymnopilus junonius]|uniref:Uncharacterized protein n=1 Tax=Gymnopilus junonius TaxID=109634 RepID=A0A9P5TH27_GYMJU|nr:hypothetical protein CPB84DRAFT_1792722 [Gymnopilus junonius]
MAMHSLSRANAAVRSLENHEHIPPAGTHSDIGASGSPSLRWCPIPGNVQGIQRSTTPGDFILPAEGSLITPLSSTSPQLAVVRSTPTPRTSPFLSLDLAALGDPYSSPTKETQDPAVQSMSSRSSTGWLSHLRSNSLNPLSRQASSSSFFSSSGARSIVRLFSSSTNLYDEPALSDTRSDVLSVQLSRNSSMVTVRGGTSTMGRNGSIMSSVTITERQRELMDEQGGGERRDYGLHGIPLAPIHLPMAAKM